MKHLLLATVLVAAFAQSALAVPVTSAYEAMPLVLTHPEFFGFGNQPPSEQDQGNVQGGRQNQTQGGQYSSIATGPTDPNSTLLLPPSWNHGNEDEISGSVNDLHDSVDSTSKTSGSFTLWDTAGSPSVFGSALEGAAPIPEPSSIAILFSVLLGIIAAMAGRAGIKDCYFSGAKCVARVRFNHL